LDNGDYFGIFVATTGVLDGDEWQPPKSTLTFPDPT